MYTYILVYPSKFYDRPSRDVLPRHLFTTARQCVGVGEIIIVVMAGRQWVGVAGVRLS